MNKIQIKAEILATLSALANSAQPDSSLLTDLKLIEDKKTVLEVLIRELVNASEHKSLLICWLLTELIDKDTLNDELWNVIKSPEYNDHVKMIQFPFQMPNVQRLMSISFRPSATFRPPGRYGHLCAQSRKAAAHQLADASVAKYQALAPQQGTFQVLQNDLNRSLRRGGGIGYR